MTHMPARSADGVESLSALPAEPVRQAGTQLSGIYEISKVLTAPARLEITLANVVNVLSSFLQIRHGAIVVLDAEGQPEIAATGDIPPASPSAARGVIPKAVIDHIVTTGTPFVVQDVGKSELFQADPQPPWSSGTVPVTFIGVPVKADKKIIGTISIDRVRNGTATFSSDEDVRFLTMVANLVGRTIRLHRFLNLDVQRPIGGQQRPEKPLIAQASAPGRHPSVKIDGIVGNSPALQQVVETVSVVARTNSTVLLRGESGTGKEFFAQAIHELSPRRKKPFVKLNCAALPEGVLESELFGHEKGAFTGAIGQRAGRFELANGGTLLLDEIGEISPAFQAKLLRVLQEGELERVGGTRTLAVDVRLICATNKNLEMAVANAEFRADLYYRISVVPIVLPPLRERPGDIPRLAKVLLNRFNKENQTELTFTPSAIDVMSQCYFPGNVRELENCVRRTATLARSSSIVSSDFACKNGQCLSSRLWKGTEVSPGGNTIGELARNNSIPAASPRAAGRTVASEDVSSVKACDPNSAGCPAMESRLTQRDRLIDAMEKAGWVQAKAARILGLTPRQVGYALRQHRIEVKKL
ncbi:Nif-specific regulatory protein NifA 1 (plasmid) [Rhizobium etli]|uniref:Nif-specific regulatory protein n=1 Tax=Rhizobium etli TaxID=29449 RepID=A0AAN1BLH0_RHIET|nr:Nif-specific regulatory protein NifA 2 [Rhizobium sp. NXC14]ARQ13374.1 Nif-specific regulatory protein NifA 1 [Rhizobium etli]